MPILDGYYGFRFELGITEYLGAGKSKICSSSGKSELDCAADRDI